jgi:hypothetical protein
MGGVPEQFIWPAVYDWPSWWSWGWWGRDVEDPRNFVWRMLARSVGR